MRYQDLEAAEDLLKEAADVDSGRLTLARVGEDRRESQVASQPLSSFAEMQEWLHGAVARTKPGEDGVKLRLRWWDGDNRSVRGVTFCVWGEREAIPVHGGQQPMEHDAGVPVVRGGAEAVSQALGGGMTCSAPPVATCPSCMMLQAGLLAARIEVAQLGQQRRRAEDRLWRAEQDAGRVREAEERARRVEEQNRALKRELGQYERALARVNRENERKSEIIRTARVVADYVNNRV